MEGFGQARAGGCDGPRAGEHVHAALARFEHLTDNPDRGLQVVESNPYRVTDGLTGRGKEAVGNVDLPRCEYGSGPALDKLTRGGFA